MINIKHITIFLIVFLFLFAFLNYNPLLLKSQNNNIESGRYQVSTLYRDTGNWIFVTVIDTQTGEIIKQERFRGFDDYKEK